jgi:hypothetical protein
MFEKVLPLNKPHLKLQERRNKMIVISDGDCNKKQMDKTINL